MCTTKSLLNKLKKHHSFRYSSLKPAFPPRACQSKSEVSTTRPFYHRQTLGNVVTVTSQLAWPPVAKVTDWPRGKKVFRSPKLFLVLRPLKKDRAWKGMLCREGGREKKEPEWKVVKSARVPEKKRDKRKEKKKGRNFPHLHSISENLFSRLALSHFSPFSMVISWKVHWSSVFSYFSLSWSIFPKRRRLCRFGRLECSFFLRMFVLQGGKMEVDKRGREKTERK